MSPPFHVIPDLVQDPASFFFFRRKLQTERAPDQVRGDGGETRRARPASNSASHAATSAAYQSV